MYLNLLNLSREFSWLTLVLPPFLIWVLASFGLLGYFALPKNYSREDNRKIFFSAIREAVRYGWEVFFTSIGLTALTIAFHFLLLLVHRTLPAVPEFVISTAGFSMIFLIYLGKVSNIVTRPPSHSILDSLKYVYGGFSNPFRDYKTYRMQ